MFKAFKALIGYIVEENYLEWCIDIKELEGVYNSPKAPFSDYWEMRNTILKIPIYIILFISYYITNLINKHFRPIPTT